MNNLDLLEMAESLVDEIHDEIDCTCLEDFKVISKYDPNCFYHNHVGEIWTDDYLKFKNLLNAYRQGVAANRSNERVLILYNIFLICVIGIMSTYIIYSMF